MGHTCSEESLEEQGLVDLLFEERMWGTGTWGVAGGGAMGWGQAQGAALGEGGLKHGEGDVGMQNECAQAMRKHSSGGTGTPCPSRATCTMRPWVLVSPVLGLSPAGGLPQHLQAPRAARAHPAKSRTSPGRVSICSPKAQVAAPGPRAQPHLSQGVCRSRLGCWCHSRSLGWLIPARQGRSPW